MASRFWAGSSSEEEDSDSSIDSDVEVNQVKPNASRWAIDSESESEDEVRVVRSAKDKAVDTLLKSSNTIKNSMKINNWSSILSEFDSMMKHIEKSKKTWLAQGYPKAYVRMLVQLEDFTNSMVADKPAQKKLSKENNKAFIRMKGKVKRLAEDMKTQLDACRENPESSSDDSSSDDSSDDSSSEDDSSDEDSDSESDSDSDSDDSETKEGMESDDDDWPSGSESDSSSDSDSDDGVGQLKGRAKWLKSATVQTSSKKERGPKVPKVARDRQRKQSVEIKTQEEVELSLSPVEFDCKLKELLAERGKRGTDTTALLSKLRRLVHFSRKLGAARCIIATMNLISAEVFDSSTNIDRFLSPEKWRSVQSQIMAVVNLLDANPGFSLQSLDSEDHAEIVRAGRGELNENNIAASNLPNDGETGVLKVSGDLSTFVDRLSDEYTKSLQQTDPHSATYFSRLFDEGSLLEVASRVQKFCVRRKDVLGAASMALLQMELKYYKHSTIAYSVHASQIRRKVLGDSEDFHPACGVSESLSSKNVECTHPGSWSGKPTCDVPSIDVEKDMKELSTFVFKHGDDRSKTRAILCHIYHHAVHDRFSEARDLLLMSHLQDTIVQADVPTQILFNRMMAQLGLCAFRSGMVAEAHGCLSEICSGSRTKELLAQGIQNRSGDRDSEQENLERRRQMPYHMHINMELLETCHMTSAMLLEVPNMASSVKLGNRRKTIISKTFRRYLDYYDRQVFSGPPETTRDHVILASKYLAQGSWSAACDLILGMSVWNLLPGKNVTENVKAMVRSKIQTEALRTYLLAYGSEYHSLSLKELCTMFSLSEKKVHSVVSKMMINEDLMATWDQSTNCVVMNSVERTKLQELALSFAEKTELMVENNERMLDYCNVSKDNDWSVRRRDDRGSSRSKKGSSVRHQKKKESSRW